MKAAFEEVEVLSRATPMTIRPGLMIAWSVSRPAPTCSVHAASLDQLGTGFRRWRLRGPWRRWRSGGQDRREVKLRGTSTFEIVGREAELASVRAFVDQAGAGLAALVLDGDAGIGKSTLWLAGVEHARARGLRVLSSRPAEAERALAHAGLSDLLENALEETLPALQAPRRRALEIVMLRAESSGDPGDQRALAVAVRDVLQLLSERGPVVIAVDDVQWLDPSSLSTLAFALRRLAANDIRVLLTRRLAGGAQLPGFGQALGTEAVQCLPVGPFSVGALHQLLRDRLGRPFAGLLL